jgi:hypothetical protein
MKCCPSICQESLRKTTDNLSQISLLPGQGLDQELPNMKQEFQPLDSDVPFQRLYSVR